MPRRKIPGVRETIYLPHDLAEWVAHKKNNGCKFNLTREVQEHLYKKMRADPGFVKFQKSQLQKQLMDLDAEEQKILGDQKLEKDKFIKAWGEKLQKKVLEPGAFDELETEINRLTQKGMNPLDWGKGTDWYGGLKRWIH